VAPAPVSEAIPAAARASAPVPYTVVARRYRPQRFEDVVGQDHIVRSLRNAIRLNRIAQAYLFCGTRGVGKTSMARIFAKCLNCVKGPTEEPCQVCDICQSIALGQDVDVIEIDGASNNGVEQVRELRQNAPLRPSRARFKIYYIDEVHMLSIGAFNALLKTLEEPPPHVKFCFATTEANKIPITVLSRCQRYDFAGITPELIAGSLGEICAREHVEAEPEALQVIARRASGSLRDAQSLLDRLLASGSQRLTVEVVHSLLGTASDERLLELLEAVANHDPARALLLVDQSAAAGIQPGELLSGLIDFMRDALVLAVGAELVLLALSPRQRPQLKRIIAGWSVDSILAALQILAECRARMRGSLYGRFLLELALVRVARLEDLTELGSLVERLDALESGGPPRKPESGGARRRLDQPEPAFERIKDEGETTGPAAVAPPPVPSAAPALAPAKSPPRLEAAPVSSLPQAAVAATSPPLESSLPSSLSSAPGAAPMAAPAPTSAEPAPAAVAEAAPEESAEPASHPVGDELPSLDLATVRKVWPDLVKKVGAALGWRLSQVEPIAVVGPDALVIAAKPGYNSVGDACGAADAIQKIEQSLQRLIHRPVRVKYEHSLESENIAADARQSDSRRSDALSSDPLVQKVVELFEARSQQLEYEEETASS
jgi:DNA polymerase-3 subunit gamma/tau